MIYALAEHEDELRTISDGWPDPFPNPQGVGYDIQRADGGAVGRIRVRA